MKREMRRAWKQDIARRKRKSMETITIKRELPEEFLSDILITAFDGAYGWSWTWFEPTERDDIVDGTQYLEFKHNSDACNWRIKDGRMINCSCDDLLWTKVGCRLKLEYHTGEGLFDTSDGFTVTHASLAQAIARIIDDNYIGTWREAVEREANEIAKEIFTDRHDQVALMGEINGRKWKWSSVDSKYMVETGETARAYRESLAKIVSRLDSEDDGTGDIDAPFADAIVQVAIFGKCIFG